VRVVDPATQDAYVLLRPEVFDRLTGAPHSADEEDPFEIPPGILRSMQAYWRDLPELLKSRRNGDKWVLYHGDERVGIERDKVTLMREVARRGIAGDAYYVAVIHDRALPPWEPEEIEPIGPSRFDDYQEEP